MLRDHKAEYTMLRDKLIERRKDLSDRLTCAALPKESTIILPLIVCAREVGHVCRRNLSRAFDPLGPNEH
jgi:hypothetical protein